MSIIKIPREIMLDILGSDDLIEDTIEDTSRWSIQHSIIFKYNDKHYSSFYSVGATEYQDESPWEYELEVECREVVEVEQLVKVWKEI